MSGTTSVLLSSSAPHLRRQGATRRMYEAFGWEEVQSPSKPTPSGPADPGTDDGPGLDTAAPPACREEPPTGCHVVRVCEPLCDQVHAAVRADRALHFGDSSDDEMSCSGTCYFSSVPGVAGTGTAQAPRPTPSPAPHGTFTPKRFRYKGGDMMTPSDNSSFASYRKKLSSMSAGEGSTRTASARPSLLQSPQKSAIDDIFPMD